jgi:integrase
VGSSLVFGRHTTASKRKGSPHQPFTFRKHFEDALDRAGISRTGADRVTLHTLRHSFVTWLVGHLLAQGMPEDAARLAVAKLAGHASLQTTARYFNPRTETLQKVNDAALGSLGRRALAPRPAPAAPLAPVPLQPERR